MKNELENIKKLAEALQSALNKVCEETAAGDFKQFQEEHLPYINDSLLWLQHLIIDENSGAISVDKEYR